MPKTPANKVSGDSVECDFDIFSWQWFLYLMNPSNGGRIFEDRSIFPVVDLDTCTSIAAGRMAGSVSQSFTPAVLKVSEMPDIPGQAGPGDALYDKNSNIVFYNRRFTKNECGIFKKPASSSQPPCSSDYTQQGCFPNAGAVNSSFLTGWDSQLVAMLTAGCDGGTNATSGIAPELTRKLYDSVMADDLDTAHQHQQSITRLFDGMFGAADFPEGFRIGLTLRGIATGPGRMPQSPAQRASAPRLTAEIQELLRGERLL